MVTQIIIAKTIGRSISITTVPILPKDCMVDVAGRWGEGYYSYPGRSDLKWSEVSRSHIRWLMLVKG